MLTRILLSTLTALLFVAVSVDVIRAQEKLPDGAFTISPDELNWQPMGPSRPTDRLLVEWAFFYRGANHGYRVTMLRIPPNTTGPLCYFGLSCRSDLDEVIRVQSGTLFLAFSERGTRPNRADAKAYGPGSFIVRPAGINKLTFSGDQEVILEATQIRNMTRRPSE